MDEKPASENAPTKLLNKNFFLLWQGTAVSMFGSEVYVVAVMLWIKEATGSPTLAGTVSGTGINLRCSGDRWRCRPHFPGLAAAGPLPCPGLLARSFRPAPHRAGPAAW